MESIILTGPKYSGKTTTGRVLAMFCSCDFIDLDELILQRTGKTPRQLYEEDPAVFKKAETEAMASLAEKSNFELGPHGTGRVVIAAGGGIIDNPDAIALLENCNAAVVYLNISADSAWDRINSPGGELPPFLRTENPRESHRVLHERRAAAYPHLAKIVIETEGKTPEMIAHEIADRAEWIHEHMLERHRTGHHDESKPHCFGRDF